MYVYNLVHTTMEVVIQFKEATENSSKILNDTQSSRKYVENMYYINIQLSPLSLNPFFLVNRCTYTHKGVQGIMGK